MSKPKLNPSKTYEIIDFDDTEMAISFLKKNRDWSIYGQLTMDEYSSWSPWTKTKIYREKKDEPK